jgi:hypothetical protein
MPLPVEIENLYLAEVTRQQFNIMQYCCSATAHRMLKWGWEPEVNSYGPRMLLLLCFYLPVHARMIIINEAYGKALICGDKPVVAFIQAAFARPTEIPKMNPQGELVAV